VKKIPSLFKRDYEGTRLVYDELVEGSEWVAEGEGVATRKWDGTACLVRDGKLYKRYDAKKGKTPPEGFIPAEDEPDPKTGHWPGWLAVGEGPEDRWYREAWFAGANDLMLVRVGNAALADGTYELCGPKVQGNPEGFSVHTLVPHGEAKLPDCPRDYDGLRRYLAEHDIEGVVWHHADGRMVKIKARDFGIKRGAK
jgi:hypothetical protein